MDRINHMANNDSSEYPDTGALVKEYTIPADLKKLPKTQLRRFQTNYANLSLI